MNIRISSPIGCLFLILIIALFFKFWYIAFTIMVVTFLIMTGINVYNGIKNNPDRYAPKKGQTYKVCPNCGANLDRSCEICPYCNTQL